MNFVKFLKDLVAKGFATEEEKKQVESQLQDVSEEVKELSQDLVTQVKGLPEDDNSDDEARNELKSIVGKVFAGEKAEFVKEVEEKIAPKLQKLLDEHKDKMEKKVGAYREEVKGDTKRKAVNDYLRTGLEVILGKSDTKEFEEAKGVLAKANENTTSASATPYAGYLTDSLLSAEIRHLITNYGVAAREMMNVSFMQSSYKANNLATDVSVYWVDEGDSISSTQAVLGQETLELKKLGAIITLTRELLQESEIDFISFLGERVAEGFAKAEDEAFFKGDGTSTYGSFTGILENSSVNEVVMDSGDGEFGDLDIVYLRKMQDATPQGALANAKYFMHRSQLTTLRNLRADAVSAGDNAGVYLFKEPEGGAVGNIDGYPIVLVEAMPKFSDSAVDTSFVLFGDLRKGCIRGTRGGINVAKTNSGIVNDIANTGTINVFTTDREAVRWIQQVGFIVIVAKAITKLTTASASN